MLQFHKPHWNENFTLFHGLKTDRSQLQLWQSQCLPQSRFGHWPLFLPGTSQSCQHLWDDLSCNFLICVLDRDLSSSAFNMGLFSPSVTFTYITFVRDMFVHYLAGYVLPALSLGSVTLTFKLKCCCAHCRVDFECRPLEWAQDTLWRSHILSSLLSTDSLVGPLIVRQESVK